MKYHPKSRRGRAPKDPSRRRKTVLKVYASHSQAALIRRRARRAGRTVSSFLLAAGREPGAVRLVPPTNREAFESPSRIGRLLNPLERPLNAGIPLPFCRTI